MCRAVAGRRAIANFGARRAGARSTGGGADQPFERAGRGGELLEESELVIKVPTFPFTAGCRGARDQPGRAPARQARPSFRRPSPISRPLPSTLPDGDPAPPDGGCRRRARRLGTRPFGVYLHVPFCATRCGYCDFNTYTAAELGRRRGPAGRVRRRRARRDRAGRPGARRRRRRPVEPSSSAAGRRRCCPPTTSARCWPRCDEPSGSRPTPR